MSELGYSKHDGSSSRTFPLKQNRGTLVDLASPPLTLTMTECRGMYLQVCVFVLFCFSALHSHSCCRKCCILYYT